MVNTELSLALTRSGGEVGFMIWIFLQAGGCRVRCVEFGRYAGFEGACDGFRSAIGVPGLLEIKNTHRP